MEPQASTSAVMAGQSLKWSQTSKWLTASNKPAATKKLEENSNFRRVNYFTANKSQFLG